MIVRGTAAALAALFASAPAPAVDRVGRIGLGASNEVGGGPPAVSVKFHPSRSFALGLLGGFDSAEGGGYAAGLKLHRNLFEEPRLQFYLALLAAASRGGEGGGGPRSRRRLDLLLGSEFSLPGLASLGLSVEAGLSLHDGAGGLDLGTTGSPSLVSAFHFYL